MKQIIKILPKERQAALFSATQTKKVEDLARLSLKDPVYVGVDDERKRVTNEGLEQGYCIVPCAMRFIILYSFLKKHQSQKVVVFFSSVNSVKFHSDLLKYIKLDCFDIHGQQNQQKRTSSFFDFCKAEKGILLCTDVAARGLDIPSVVANLVTLQGEGQPFVRNVLTLKSCSPIVRVDVMSFGTEREVLLAWRVMFLAEVTIILAKRPVPAIITTK